MEKILISACLIGDKCRYDGKSNYNPLIEELLKYYELVPFCPEVEGGLSTPRDPSERIKDQVRMENGRNVTHQFHKGADLAINVCLYLGIRIAILKEGSPSCGVNEIYDGTFQHRKIKGEGVTTHKLKHLGVRVYSENDIEQLIKEKIEIK